MNNGNAKPAIERIIVFAAKLRTPHTSYHRPFSTHSRRARRGGGTSLQVRVNKIILPAQVSTVGKASARAARTENEIKIRQMLPRDIYR